MWSAQWDGWINLAAGVSQFQLWADGQASLSVDGRQLTDSFLNTDSTVKADPNVSTGSPIVGFNSATAGWHRVTIRFANTVGAANLNLWITPPGGSSQLAEGMKPDWGLLTSTTGPDGVVTTSEYGTGGSLAPYGLLTKSVVDPTGLKLISATDYEAPSASTYLRRKSRTLPGGFDATGTAVTVAGGAQAATSTYTHYAAVDTTPAVTCPAAVPPGQTVIAAPTVGAAPQGGLAKQSTAADPDGDGTAATPIVRSQVWDSQGRQAAFGVVGDATWSCVRYDTRGRVTGRAWPAHSTSPARAEATTYTTTGTSTTMSGMTVKTTDTAATAAGRVPVESTVDLLGRVWRYVDEWGTVTTIDFDVAGRQTAVRVRRSGAGSDDLTLAYSYVQSGAGVNQLEVQRVDGATAATVTYDSVGRQAGVTYANGTTKTAPLYDGYQRVTTAEYKTGATLVTSDELTYQAVTGRVTDQKVDGQANYTGGQDFVYDNAGRLTTWWGRDPATANVYRGTIRYDDYTSAPACATSSKTAWGRNSNRLEQRIRRYSDNTGATLTADASDTSCYDNADRLTTFNPATGVNAWASPVYDSHGNLTSSGTEVRSYDATDRHLSTTATVAASTPTPTVVATSKVQAAGGTGTLAVPKPTGLQVGDLVVVFVTHDAAQWMPTPSGFTFGDYADNYGSGMSPQMRAVFFWKTATTTDVSGSGWTFTVPGPPASTSTAVAGAFRGVDTGGSNDLVWADGNFSNSGTGGWSDNWSGNATATTLTSPQVTTQGVNRLLVTFTASASNGVTFTPPSGFTEHADTTYATGRNIEVAAKAHAAAGASGAATTTASTGSGLIGFHFALKPQAVGASTTTVEYNRDVADRVIERKIAGVTQQRYTHTAASDSPTLTLDAGNNVLEKTINLPGGVLWTKRSAGDVWSYPNIHGDITATTNATGVKQGGTRTYDPYGNPLGTATLVDNNAGNWDYTWHGSQQRPLEHEPNLTPTIEMGARQYSPQLGRFIETDPVEGGTPNDYIYPTDPANGSDLDGQAGPCGLGTTAQRRKCKMTDRRFRAFQRAIRLFVDSNNDGSVNQRRPKGFAINASVCPVFGCVAVVFDGGYLKLSGGVGLAVSWPGLRFGGASASCQASSANQIFAQAGPPTVAGGAAWEWSGQDMTKGNPSVNMNAPGGLGGGYVHSWTSRCIG